MRLTRRVFLFSVLIASIALALAFGMNFIWLGAISALGIGLIGWLGQRKEKWFWTIRLFFVAAMILVMIGVFLGLRLYLLLPAILGVLAAWDLARFQQRIKTVPVSARIRRIEKRHLSLLGLALGSGGIFAGFALITRMQIGFGITLALGVILIISFGQIYRVLTS